MNGVIYCRVSSKEQVDGTSLESQELACRDFAIRNHINVVRVFIERGESAKFADRTQLLELLAFCRDRAKAVNCLLVWKVDRLARNVGDHFNIKANLLQRNIRVISVTEPIDSKPEGKLLETILAGFAQFDNDIRAARTVQGLRRKIQEGLFPFCAPLGYKSATPGRKKTIPDQPDQPAFRIIQKGWNEFATGRYMKVEILRLLTKWGLRTRAGKTISKQSLDNIFRDRFYAGILRDPWSGEEYPARHVPMVSLETFKKVQQLLDRSPVSVPHKSIRESFPLRVFVRCGNCEEPLTGSISRGRSQLYPYYHCFNRQCDLRGNYSVDSVHREFIEFLRESSLDNTTFEKLKGKIQAIIEGQTETNRILHEKTQLELQRVKQQEQQLVTMRINEIITDEEFVEQRSIIAKRRAGLQDAEQTQIVNSNALLGQIDQVRGELRDLSHAWQTIPVEFQRRFQQLLLPRGYVFGRVGTAPKGHILSFIGGFRPTESNLVHPMGLSWNQLASDIDAFSTIIKESSDVFSIRSR